MKTINEQLDKEMFTGCSVLLFRLRPHLRIHPVPHPYLPIFIIDEFYIGWNYGNSVLDLK